MTTKQKTKQKNNHSAREWTHLFHTFRNITKKQNLKSNSCVCAYTYTVCAKITKNKNTKKNNHHDHQHHHPGLLFG